MSVRTKPPFRADHVGSLLRPPSLSRARDDFAAGRISAAALRRVEDDAIAGAVKMQEEVGLQSVTDGEMRRYSWLTDFIKHIGGFEEGGNSVKIPFEGPQGTIYAESEPIRVTQKLHLKEPIFADDFKFLKSVTKNTAKLTIPSPVMIMGRRPADSAIYADREAFEADLTRVFSEEIAALHKIGCIYLQLDDASLPAMADPNRRSSYMRAGFDPDTLHLTAIAVANAALKGRPQNMTVTTHLCRGNYRSSHYASGGYDPIAEALFNQLDVDGFFLEYDDERSGGFEPLRFLPKGKMVVLGLITSMAGALESKDQIKRRIDEAARFIDLDQLCLSPQCGFASTAEGNLITADEQKAKLALVVEIARDVWA
jgi:5-methyltetrahydropteroyltriglutamate--homocysteine methyltransferase